jgi:hypothetical protein
MDQPHHSGDPPVPPPSIPGEVQKALDLIHDAIGVVQRCDPTLLDRVALETLTAGVIQETRRLQAACIRAVAGAARSQVPTADGHRTPRSWVKWVGRLSGPEASFLARCAAAFRFLTRWRAAFEDGTVGAAQVGEILSLWHDTRLRRHVCDAEELLLSQARSLPFDDFAVACRRFAALADHDGDADRHRDRHDDRDAFTSRTFDGSFHLQTTQGALRGAAMAEIFERFVAAQFQAEQVASDGGTAVRPRTPAQLRADALFELFRSAASAAPGARRPEPLVSVVVTAPEYEAILAAASTSASPRFDPSRFPVARMETRDRIALTPRDILEASALGWVRRVVVDPVGHVIDLGRRQRLFTGAAREAALLTSHRCTWAGGACEARHGFLHVDHAVAHRIGGATDQINASPLCGHHNRLKESGFRVARDATGTWHTYRADGTPIQPPAPPRSDHPTDRPAAA